MPLRFRLHGLAETFLDKIHCPCCGRTGCDDQDFATDLTKVTFDGIVVVVQCKTCSEIFVPDTQRLGILNPLELKKAVLKDIQESGLPALYDLQAVRLNVEKLNALRKGECH